MRKIIPPILVLLSSCVSDASDPVNEMHKDLLEIKAESQNMKRRTDSAMHVLDEMEARPAEVEVIKVEVQRDTITIESEPERVMMMVRPYYPERPIVIRDTIYIYRIDTFYMDVD